jgi:phosphopantetheinyl transferase
VPVNGVWVSWSHTSAAVVVAVSRSEIGVDVETTRSLSAASAEIEAMICTPDESASLPQELSARHLALARLWTAKEALIKVGEASLGDLRRTHAGICSDGRTWPGKQRSWYLTPFELDGAVGIVAGAIPARVHQFDLARLAV